MTGKRRIEAKQIAERELERETGGLSYTDLRAWIANKKSVRMELKGASGVEYQVEIEAMWDAKPEGVIRVWASVDDGRGIILRSECADRLVSPDIRSGT